MMEETEFGPSLTKVWAKNFRSIEYAELELGPLTVLVGTQCFWEEQFARSIVLLR